VASAFDAIAQLASPVDGTERATDRYTAVLAAVEPIERRPETAVQTLRQLAGNARLLLFGHPTLEPLSRKMLSFGCDDYVVTPATPAELQQLFGAVPLRLTTDTAPDVTSDDASAPLAASPPTKLSLLRGVPLAEIVLDAMIQHPQAGPCAAVRLINDQIGPTMRLIYLPVGKTPAPAPEGSIAVTHAVRVLSEDVAMLHLSLPRDEEESGARHFLAQLAHLIGKLATLEDRHTRLQKLAITDDLTGIYNGRYFRHFLTRIIEKARVMRFPVTLLLFDIDNFKQYNDLYGHGMGDEILREAASLMKRCCREHDLVARISGDEFAVVFWEKEGPRQPRDAKPQAANAPAPASRLPQEPKQILERFQRMLSLPDFSNLGASGKGSLTISGGLAVYPYDAHDVQGLIDAADQALVFGAKQGGKNRIHIVGQNEMNTEAP
ncbi:MAG: GGDEF domain-containing protein, partial [Chthoniobacterales bacterium]|nr:GGDEF domain-containing protein [Chthoniobacterales bacterium]